MCTYGSRFFVVYKFLATGKKSERQRDRENAGPTEVHFSNKYHTAPRSNKIDRGNHCC